MNYYRNNIRHVKGDTYSSGLVVEGLGQDLDNIYMTCRDSLNDDSEILFEKALNNGITLVEYDEENDIRKYAIRIAPADTKDLQAGTYYYDLQVDINSDVFTVMKGQFIIEQEVTRKDEGADDPELYIKVILDEINGEVIGVSVIDKTDYLNETKDLLKDRLNNFGAGITDEDTFRSYVEAIDTIYEDYPKVTGEGTSITLNNTKEARMEIELKGKTSQYTTTGKNIFPRITFSQTINGVTITATGDGTIKIKGTANSSGVNHPIWGAWASSTTLFTIPAGTYTASGIGTRQQSPRMNIVTNGTTSIFVTNTTQTLDSDTNVTGIFIWVDAGTTVDTTFKPMIETGSSATSYEPYTGKKASPNPDFPQDVNVVTGSNTIKLENKNLVEGLEFGDIRLWDGAEDTSTVILRTTNFIPYDTLATYYQSLDGQKLTNTTGFRFYNKNKEYIGYATFEYDSGTTNPTVVIGSSVTTTDLEPKYFKVRMASTTVPSETSNYMVAKSSDLTYIEHQEQNYEINLGKNLINATDLTFGTISQSDGVTISTSTSVLYTQSYIKVNSNQKYTISYNGTANASFRLFYYDNSKTYLSTAFVGGSQTPYATFTTLSNAGYIRIQCANNFNNELQLEVGSTATSYSPYFTPIEVCENDEFQRNNNGDWYLHKTEGKIVLDDTYNWTRETSSTWVCPRFICTTLPDLGTTVNGTVFNNSLCNMATVGSTSDYTQNENVFLLRRVNNTNRIDCMFDLASVDELKALLAVEPMEIYYPLVTPTDILITNETLKVQLEALKSVYSYDGVTNITQSNADLEFIISASALMKGGN